MDDQAATSSVETDKAGNPFARIPIEITVSVGKSCLTSSATQFCRSTNGSTIRSSFMSVTS